MWPLLLVETSFRLLLGGGNHFEAEAALDVLAVLDCAQPQVLHHNGRVVLRRQATGVLSFDHKKRQIVSLLKYFLVSICHLMRPKHIQGEAGTLFTGGEGNNRRYVFQPCRAFKSILLFDGLKRNTKKNILNNKSAAACRAGETRADGFRLALGVKHEHQFDCGHQAGESLDIP